MVVGLNLPKMLPDTTPPTVTVKDDSVGSDGVYTKVSFKLFDAREIDKVVLNGVTKDLTDNVWSDLDGVKPGDGDVHLAGHLHDQHARDHDRQERRPVRRSTDCRSSSTRPAPTRARRSR